MQTVIFVFKFCSFNYHHFNAGMLVQIGIGEEVGVVGLRYIVGIGMPALADYVCGSASGVFPLDIMKYP